MISIVHAPSCLSARRNFGPAQPPMSKDFGKDVTEPRTGMADRPAHFGRAIPILNVGRMGDQPEQQAKGVGDDMTPFKVALEPVARSPLTPLIFLPVSKPEIPPLSVVLTLWVSITPALGLASRPSSSRVSIARTKRTARRKPLSR